MAVRSLRARIINPDSDLRAALQHTHRVFNLAVRQMVERYLEMRSGRLGEELKRIAEIMLGGAKTGASPIMEKLSDLNSTFKNSTLGKKAELVDLIQKVRSARGVLFDRHQAFARVDGRPVRDKGKSKAQAERSDGTARPIIVSSKFWRWVCNDACEVLRGNKGQIAQWKEDRKQWVKERNEWIKDHAEFMAFWNGPYREFEKSFRDAQMRAQQAKGQIATAKKRDRPQRGKRHERWLAWYEWIVRHPNIIEWRGTAKAADFQPLPDEEKARIQRRNKRQDKCLPKFLAWLRDNNPELAELDRQKKDYLDQYRRFKRPPTLTLPSPDKHPRWLPMERDILYRSFDPERGSIELLLIDEGADGIGRMNWFPAQVRVDLRLKPSYRAEVFARDGRLPPMIEGKPGGKLSPTAPSPEERKSGRAGAKLIFRNNSAHLIFTVTDQNCPPRVVRRKVPNRTCSADNVLSPQETRIPLRILAVDLGVRHIGAFAVAEGRQENGAWHVSWITRGIVNAPQLPNLHAMYQHDRQLRRGRRIRGKPVRGEEAFVELQDHRTAMADDRFKKGANTIVELARTHKVHVILFESLKGFLPTARDERWVNKQKVKMLRRKIVNMVSDQAKEFGLLCDESISPAYTSQFCSRCFRPGWRFSMKAKAPWSEKKPRAACADFGYPIWDGGGHLFRCPHCGYRVNADVNAAGNIAAKFFGLFPRDIKKSKEGDAAIYKWTENGQSLNYNAGQAFENWACDVRERKESRKKPDDIPY